jgi:uncharacterized membrane protein YpjA
VPVLPVAVEPLWQLAQPTVTVTLACNLAGSQFGYAALWQVEQLSEVETCFEDLPVAVVPLWQLKQSVTVL